jgi:hypothetical protein
VSTSRYKIGVELREFEGASEKTAATDILANDNDNNIGDTASSFVSNVYKSGKYRNKNHWLKGWFIRSGYSHGKTEKIPDSQIM